MSKGNGTKTPDEGARTPVCEFNYFFLLVYTVCEAKTNSVTAGLAIQDFGGKTGAFYKNEKELAWEDL
jgi:hypothetical protein